MLGKKDNHSLRKVLSQAILILFVLAVVGVILLGIQRLFGSPHEAALKLRSMGAFGPIVLIALIIMGVVVAPVPDVVFAIASGYAFGGLFGTIYSYLGNIIGTCLAFFLSRKFGRPLVEHLAKKEKLDYFDGFFRDVGTPFLWIVFIFPFFPSDIVSFATGLSDLSWKKFVLIASIGYLPNMFMLNFLGASMFDSGFSGQTFFFGALLLFAAVLGWLMYMKDTRKFKKAQA